MEDLFGNDSPKVYVGTMEFPFRGMLMSHMCSPDIDALHRMADAIGIKREWFQDHEVHPHYDVSKAKKKLAIKLGAIEINDREIIRLCHPKSQICRAKRK